MQLGREVDFLAREGGVRCAALQCCAKEHAAPAGAREATAQPQTPQPSPSRHLAVLLQQLVERGGHRGLGHEARVQLGAPLPRAAVQHLQQVALRRKGEEGSRVVSARGRGGGGACCAPARAGSGTRSPPARQHAGRGACLRDKVAAVAQHAPEQALRHVLRLVDVGVLVAEREAHVGLAALDERQQARHCVAQELEGRLAACAGACAGPCM